MDAQPFFTNDIVGFIKLTVSLAGTAATIVGGVWKITRGPLQDEDKRLATMIGSLHDDIEIVHNDIESHRRSFMEINRRVDAHDTDMRHISTNFAELKGQVSAFAEQSNVNKTEIIDMFQKKGDEIIERVHALDKECYALRMVWEDRTKRESE